jgi:plastocyanin
VFERKPSDRPAAPQSQRIVISEEQPRHGIPAIHLSAAAERFDADANGKRRNWPRRLLLAGGVLVGLLFVSVVLLALADFTMAGNGSSDWRARAQWTWERGDRLHYAGHLAIGRVLDLCPCTRRAADAQYYYARFHAISPLQRQVVSNTRPAGPAAVAAYVVGPVAVGAEWLGDGLKWLGGQRPLQQATIDLEEFEVRPAQMRIPRGATVTWRNTDDLGEAHTVTADIGQAIKFDSGFLVPSETFEFTFTERGRYIYYCQVHGGPQLQGMSGEIVVE